MGSNANEKKHHKHNMPRDFPDVVDWSALLIDLWRHPDGSCPSWVVRVGFAMSGIYPLRG
jgi:hypothetical protein